FRRPASSEPPERLQKIDPEIDTSQSKHIRLNQAVDVIHLRFGERALAAVDRLPAVEAWPVGLAAIDGLTGIGGLPRGRVCVLSGRGTCGKSSLGLALLAQATREFAAAIVVDPGRSFDPWALMEFQPDLRTLTVVRPGDAAAAGEAAVSLAKAGAGFLLLSLPTRIAAAAEPWLPLLASAAERSGAIAVVVVEETPRALAHTSSLSLGVERLTWKIERGELVGLRARVTCFKNKVSMPGRMTELEINYPIGAGLYPELQKTIQEQGGWERTGELESAVV
ncbi:MAG: DNA recombination/repair protein RecA, partial [Candidatus Dormibacteraeota bacterium]|nr:DNA recombination/repair protein RecA [Candidatus Dormibacteraeota bacterium]